MDALTASDISAILAQNRNRGGLDKFLTDFTNSGDMYRVINEVPQFAGKSKEQLNSVKNQLTMKAKKADLSNIRLVKKDDTILIVNTEKLVTEGEDN